MQLCQCSRCALKLGYAIANKFQKLFFHFKETFFWLSFSLHYWAFTLECVWSISFQGWSLAAAAEKICASKKWRCFQKSKLILLFVNFDVVFISQQFLYLFSRHKDWSLFVLKSLNFCALENNDHHHRRRLSKKSFE